MDEETTVTEVTPAEKTEEKPKEDEGILSEDVAVVLFNELSQGYREWEVNGDKYRTRFPTPKEDASARMAYAAAFNEALDKDIPSQKQMMERLRVKGIWADEDDKEVSAIREKIGQLELILSKKDPHDKTKTTRKLAGELLEMRGKAIEKSSRLNEYMANTIEALAEEVKQAYYVSTCTENTDGTRVWPTPEDFMNSKDTGLVNSATYEYVTFTNGLAENYIEMLPEVQFLKSGKGEESDKKVKE